MTTCRTWTAAPLFALLISTVATAQGYNRQDVVRGLCQKDGCDEFVLADKREVAKGSDGTLYRTRVKTYHASNKGRVDRGEEGGFVYCSASRPAIISGEEGQPPVAIFLAPEDQSPAHIQRQSANFYALYFAFCHDIESGRAAAQDRKGVAQRLNYRVPLSQPKTVTLKRAEDVLEAAPTR